MPPQKTQSSNSLALLIVICGVVIIAILAFIIIFVVANKDGESTPDAAPSAEPAAPNAASEQVSQEAKDTYLSAYIGILQAGTHDFPYRNESQHAAIADICGDETPELILVDFRDEDILPTMAETIELYSFDGEKCVNLLSEKLYPEAPGGACLFTDNEGSLYLHNFENFEGMRSSLRKYVFTGGRYTLESEAFRGTGAYTMKNVDENEYLEMVDAAVADTKMMLYYKEYPALGWLEQSVEGYTIPQKQSSQLSFADALNQLYNQLPYTRPLFTSADASASVSSDTYNYSPQAVLDGSPDTAWNCPKQDGSWIMLYSAERQFVQGIRILNGYTAFNSEYGWIYGLNSRPKSISVAFSDGSSFDYLLDDIFIEGKYVYQSLDFGEVKETSFIKILVNSVYPGSKWSDICISEIQAY